MNRTFNDSPAFPPQNFMDLVTITNLASGGAIGTAIDTVDQYQGALIVQTTASQTLSLPSPTGDTPKVFFVVNAGSVSFTINQKVIFPGTMVIGVYSSSAIANIGKAWTFSGISATITTTTSTTSA